MPDEVKKNNPKARRRWVLAVVLPGLYMLSIGPAFKLAMLSGEHLPLVSKGVIWFYNFFFAPLNWVAVRSPWLLKTLKWYMALFD